MKSCNHFYQNLFFKNLDLLRGRKTISRLKFLRRSQYWDHRQLETWQLSRLNELLNIAVQQSPFYAQRLSGLQLPLRSLSDIQQIPILSKQDISGNLEKILCGNANRKKLELSKTGGSTGEPTFYYLDWNSKDWNRGSVYRSSEWADVHLGDKTVQMTGSHFDFTEFNKLKWRIVFALQRYKDLPVATVNDEIYDRYFRIIQQYKPSSIWGYASGIYLFSQFIKEQYPNADFPFLQALVTSSETLRPEWRLEINRIFKGEKVFDHYGSREMYIASECKEHNGYHIHAEVILLEVVDSMGRQVPPGEMGRILVTDLTNLSFPFVRYDIGDVGILGNKGEMCPCGVSLPRLKSIEGRVADIVVLPDRKLTPPNFTILMSDFEGIDEFQILQAHIDSLHVKIVKNSKYTQGTESYVKMALKKLAGNDATIAFEYVDAIKIPESGKRRYIISSVDI